MNCGSDYHLTNVISFVASMGDCLLHSMSYHNPSSTRTAISAVHNPSWQQRETRYQPWESEFGMRMRLYHQSLPWRWVNWETLAHSSGGCCKHKTSIPFQWANLQQSATYDWDISPKLRMRSSQEAYLNSTSEIYNQTQKSKFLSAKWKTNHMSMHTHVPCLNTEQQHNGLYNISNQNCESFGDCKVIHIQGSELQYCSSVPQ
jgi:hypothetical protein